MNWFHAAAPTLGWGESWGGGLGAINLQYANVVAEGYAVMEL